MQSKGHYTLKMHAGVVVSERTMEMIERRVLLDQSAGPDHDLHETDGGSRRSVRREVNRDVFNDQSYTTETTETTGKGGKSGPSVIMKASYGTAKDKRGKKGVRYGKGGKGGKGTKRVAGQTNEAKAKWGQGCKEASGDRVVGEMMGDMVTKIDDMAKRMMDEFGVKLTQALQEQKGRHEQELYELKTEMMAQMANITANQMGQHGGGNSGMDLGRGVGRAKTKVMHEATGSEDGDKSNDDTESGEDDYGGEDAEVMHRRMVNARRNIKRAGNPAHRARLQATLSQAEQVWYVRAAERDFCYVAWHFTNNYVFRGSRSRAAVKDAKRKQQLREAVEQVKRLKAFGQAKIDEALLGAL